MNIFEYAFVSINGSSLSLDVFQGQPLLVVNTASECEYTPQYAGLQKTWADYRKSNLVILGIPCNDFGAQEPGNEEEIARFCASQYEITFPMTAKCAILGSKAHPLFKDMLEEFGNDIMPRWNFYKYLFNRHGALVDFWPSKIVPGDPLINHQIELNLQSWVL